MNVANSMYNFMLTSVVIIISCYIDKSFQKDSQGDKSVEVFKRKETMSTQLSGIRKKEALYSLEDFKQNMIISTNWEQALVAAPMSVSCIAQLVLLSDEKDFELNMDNVGNYTGYLHYSMFKPAIIQLGNEAWKSFNNAEKSTDRLKVLMTDIVSNAKEAARMLLSKGNDDIMGETIIIPLELMHDDCMQSIALAKDTEESFLNTMGLLLELSEVMISTESYQQLRLELSIKKLEIAKQEYEHINETIQRRGEKLAILEENLEANKKAFEEAMDKIPTGWDAVFQNVVAGFSLKDIFGHGGNSRKINLPSNEENSDETNSEQLALKISESIVKTLIELKGCMVQSKSNITNNISKPVEEITKFKNTLNIVNEFAISQIKILQSLTSTNRTELVINMLSNIVNFTNEITASIGSNSDDLDKIFDKSKNLIDFILKPAQQFVAQGAYHNGVPPMSQDDNIDGRSDFAVGELEKFKANVRKNMLLQSRDEVERQFEKMEKAYAASFALQRKMAELDFDKINSEEIRKIVIEAITEMKSLRLYWQTILRFFENLVTAVEYQMKTAVNKFVKYSTGVANSAKKEKKLNLVKNSIFNSMARINAVAGAVKTVSETYTNISWTYVTTPLLEQLELTQLGKNERKQERLKLLQKSVEITDKIKSLVQSKKDEYNINISKKIEKIAEIFKITGQPTTEEQDNIKDEMEENFV